ncbi:hypothetical protein SUGI_0768480 [Cryptomeria japonica]|nr:hypothetical protein SUGI_0768480 [Cryptomeria japonica]
MSRIFLTSRRKSLILGRPIENPILWKNWPFIRGSHGKALSSGLARHDPEVCILSWKPVTGYPVKFLSSFVNPLLNSHPKYPRRFEKIQKPSAKQISSIPSSPSQIAYRTEVGNGRNPKKSFVPFPETFTRTLSSILYAALRYEG